MHVCAYSICDTYCMFCIRMCLYSHLHTFLLSVRKHARARTHTHTHAYMHMHTHAHRLLEAHRLVTTAHVMMMAHTSSNRRKKTQKQKMNARRCTRKLYCGREITKRARYPKDMMTRPIRLTCVCCTLTAYTMIHLHKECVCTKELFRKQHSCTKALLHSF